MRRGTRRRDGLPRGVGRRLPGRYERQPVRNPLVAVDAGFRLVRQMRRVHVLRANALAGEIHRGVLMAVSAFQ